MFTVSLSDDAADDLVITVLQDQWQCLANGEGFFDPVQEEKLLRAIEVVLHWFMSDRDYEVWRAEWIDKQIEDYKNHVL
jgi:hypothetical protein